MVLLKMALLLCLLLQGAAAGPVPHYSGNPYSDDRYSDDFEGRRLAIPVSDGIISTSLFSSLTGGLDTDPSKDLLAELPSVAQTPYRNDIDDTNDSNWNFNLLGFSPIYDETANTPVTTLSRLPSLPSLPSLADFSWDNFPTFPDLPSFPSFPGFSKFRLAPGLALPNEKVDTPAGVPEPQTQLLLVRYPDLVSAFNSGVSSIVGPLNKVFTGFTNGISDLTSIWSSR